VSRILILLMFVFWLAWKPEYNWPPVFGVGPSLVLFLGVYALLILGTGSWSRWLSRRVAGVNFRTSLERFNRVIFVARIFIPLWFIVGIGLLGWWQIVERLLATPRVDLTQTLIGVTLGTLPAFAAWIGLWWSQYPAEVAFREQGVLAQLDLDLPVHRPPGFRSYFLSNLRLQLLFMIVPVCLIVLLHDLLRLGATLAVGTRWGLSDAENPFTWLIAATSVFLFAPEILRRVLHTEPLANSPLRRRLESLCRRTGVKYRDILLWRTDNNVGNAAVMGFVPRYRYILLSDLLIETMTEEQVEAVFAHELGHIVHRHMAWLVVFIIVLTLFNLGGGAWVGRWMSESGMSSEAAQGIVIGTAYLFKFLLLFGFVSRRFERQADVFAARTMELSRASVPDVAASEMLLAARQLSAETAASAGASTATATCLPVPVLEYTSDCAPGHVGQYGAAVFGSALHRVAMVNNIPVRARSWCHGSIANRMQYLHDLSTDPTRTKRFDRFMFFLYGGMLFALFAGAAFCWASNALH
jgi:STE24 endopeptidase